MKTRVSTLASWTYNGVEFSIVESVGNLCPASGAPDICLLTFDGFRTYKRDGHVYVEVSDAHKKEKAIAHAQRIFATPKDSRDCGERRIRSLERLEAYKYKISLYGPEYAKLYEEEKDKANSTGYYGIRIVDTGRDLLEGFNIIDDEDNVIIDDPTVA